MTHVPPAARPAARELAWLFAVALLLRLAAFFLHGCAEHAAGKDAWSWGYESGCIAQSLADGHGYAGQWARAEGPYAEHAPVTGWLAPAYPYGLALLMELGGGVTPTTAGLLLGIQCVLSALTCVLVFGLGAALGGRRLARVAGWALAFLPYAIWNAAHTVWDTTCVAFVLAGFAWLVVRFGRDASVGRSALLGLAFGLVLLVNPAPASIVPAALWIVASASPSWSGRIARVAAFGAVAFLVVLPWCLRNREAVGSFAVRTNLGVEMMVGNNDLANGYFQVKLHPSYNPDEFRAYIAQGEVPYAAACMERAKAWIRADPLRFARLTLHRARLYWFGDFPWSDPRTEGTKSAASDPGSWVKWGLHGLTGLLCVLGCALWAKRGREHRALVVMLLLFPAPYYLTHVLERYRFPIEPLMLLPACAFLLWVVDRARGSSALAPGEPGR
ncbi:MAG: glycosyltransferase family 39 protein [Planctomycetes bacterium]|nr:glycosyltransferase family 39 protein [Planctomycetota bacterium]